MKMKLVKTIMSSLAFTCALGCLVAAMALGTSGNAQATAAFPQPCGVLNGLYLWTFDGYAIVNGNLVPKAVMQGIQFNGDGTTINQFGTVNVGGSSFDVSGTVGTYTVAPNCTGTISTASGLSFNMYVGPGARQLWITQAGVGFGLGVGTATRLP